MTTEIDARNTPEQRQAIAMTLREMAERVESGRWEIQSWSSTWEVVGVDPPIVVDGVEWEHNIRGPRAYLNFAFRDTERKLSPGLTVIEPDDFFPTDGGFEHGDDIG